MNSRPEQIGRLAKDPFDLVVLGGGILGCWTALDAAGRGLKVALLERSDWGAGTSSASSKLIHGGLRYLEHGWFGLVRKALAERRTLLDIAPHRVRPLRFLLPLQKHTRFNRWTLPLGLWLYDRIAGHQPGITRSRHWNAQTFAAKFPWLESAGLRGGFSYGDAQVDDARLTLEIALAARAAGAVALTHISGIPQIEDNRLVGVEACDQQENRKISITAKSVVTARGPWFEDTSSIPRRCTKGVHLVLPALPQREAMLITSPEDGRVGFLIPWEGRTLLGTTDTDWTGDPDTLGVSAQEESYLLAMAAPHLARPFTTTDVLGRFAGIRVLQNAGDGTPSSATREWELREIIPGLLVPLGGKLTSARVEAGLTVDRVLARLGHPPIPCSTNQPLPRAPREHFGQWLETMTRQGEAIGLSTPISHHLAGRYGTAVTDLLEAIRNRPDLNQPIHPELPYLHAEAHYAVFAEDALDLSDILRRRIPAAILSRLEISHIAPVATLVAPLLGWDEARCQRECDSFLCPQTG